MNNSQYSTISGGAANYIYTNYATIPGGQGAVATNYGQLAYSSGTFLNSGDSQFSLYVLRCVTIDGTTPVKLTLNYPDPAQIILPNNVAFAFTIRIVGRSTGNSSDYCVFNIQGGANGGTTPISNWFPTGGITPIFNNFSTAPNATIDVSAGFLEVKVIGCTASNIRWTATVENTEVSY